jgi:Domain of unknown function (DUF1833)
MANDLSLVAAMAAYAQETKEVVLALITLSHPDLDDDYRATNNTVAIVSRGNVYSPTPFDVTLSPDEADRLNPVTLTISNILPDIMRAVRTVNGPPGLVVECIVASDPDAPLFAQTYKVSRVEGDDTKITGTLIFDDVFNEPYPFERFTPANSLVF